MLHAFVAFRLTTTPSPFCRKKSQKGNLFYAQNDNGVALAAPFRFQANPRLWDPDHGAGVSRENSLALKAH
jgi:hypothetical protein